MSGLKERLAAGIGAAVAAGALALSGPAAAATVFDVIYEGRISNGYDYTGEFGIAGGSLNGFAATLAFHVDTGAPGAVSTVTDGFVSLVEGPGVVTATITVNGFTHAFGTAYAWSSGSDSREDDSLFPGCPGCFVYGTFGQFVNDAGEFDDGDGARHVVSSYASAFGYASDGSVTGIAHTPVNFTNPPVGMGASAVILESIGGFDSHYAFLNFAPDRVSSGTPEPAAWALLILGFGGAGVVLRRRMASRA